MDDQARRTGVGDGLMQWENRHIWSCILFYVRLSIFKWENSFWINNLYIILGLSTPGISLSLSSANPGEKERTLCPWDHGIQKFADAESRWTNVCFLVNFHPFCFLVRLFNYVLRFTSVKRVYFPFCVYWVIVTVIELEAIVALYNKSLEAISYVCFEHVQCTVQYADDSKKAADISKAQYSIPWPNRIMGLLKEGKISFSLWLNTNAGKLFLMQPPYSKDLRRRALCPGIAVTSEIRSTLAKRVTFCSWYVHCIPRTSCYLSATPLACRGIF